MGIRDFYFTHRLFLAPVIFSQGTYNNHFQNHCNCFHSAHVKLWIEYTILFVFLSMLIPCLWVAYIWEQIIDPHYESDSIAIPDHKLLRLFYSAAKKINTSLLIRTVIFFIVATLIVTSAVIDVVSTLVFSYSIDRYPIYRDVSESPKGLL